MQSDPDIEEEQRQAHKQEAQSSIVRSGPGAGFFHHPVTGFNSKAAPIQFSNRAKRQIGHMEQDVDQPLGFARALASSGKSAHYGDGDSQLTIELAAKSMFGAVAAPSLAQRPGPPFLPPDRGSQDGWQIGLGQQVGQDGDGTEAF